MRRKAGDRWRGSRCAKEEADRSGRASLDLEGGHVVWLLVHSCEGRYLACGTFCGCVLS